MSNDFKNGGTALRFNTAAVDRNNSNDTPQNKEVIRERILSNKEYLWHFYMGI